MFVNYTVYTRGGEGFGGEKTTLICGIMRRMSNPALADFIRKRPSLIWYSKDYDNLPEESIVEHVLNYGDWDDFQEMIRIMGINRAAQIFREQAFRQRTNYRKRTRHFFNLYFNKYVSA